MKACFYTSAYFLDHALEFIQAAKKITELDVFIEITEYSKNATVLNINSIKKLNFLELPENVLGKKEYSYFAPYFEGVKSVHFVVRKSPRSFSFQTLKESYQLSKIINKINPDVLHFDHVSTSCLGLYPFLKARNIVVSIHDPVAHSGENNIKQNLVNTLFKKITKAYLFYSKYSAEIFKKNNSQSSIPVYNIHLQPYSFLQNYISTEKAKSDYILFFGRLSLYKGIDILLEAIPIVLKTFPNEKFIIAGSPSYNYKIDNSTISSFKENLTFITAYLPIEELANLINNSKFVVCPYRDATQSGVLMSTFAIGKMAVVSNVGSFPEYVTDGYNGILAESDAKSVAEKIIDALLSEKYKTIQNNIKSKSTEEELKMISDGILKSYTQN